jgi:hypothetical protein
MKQSVSGDIITADHATARLAGFIYLIVVVAGIFSLSVAPDRIFVGDGAVAIAASVARHVELLRWSIVAELVCYTAFLFLPLVLLKLFDPVGRHAAIVMALLAMVSVPLAFANVGHQFEILRLATGDAHSGAYTDAESQAATMLAVRAAYRDGMLMLQIFWGGWLIPFGMLVFASGFLPRALGVLLGLAGVGYVADFIGRMLLSDYSELGIASYLRAPRVSEILICFWLLLFGARRSLWPPKTVGRARTTK